MERIKCPQCRFANAIGRTTCERCGSPLPLSEIASAGDFGPAAATEFRRGQLVAKRYMVQSMIGRGGMGRIYKVHDNTLNEIVALKTLLPQYVQDPMVVDRFFNEARIARGLSHPHIVRVHDIGTADETVYISMEFVQGKSLREVLEGLGTGRQLALGTVLRIFSELANALEYAHKYTVHRDIKPENVMICTNGTVKLMDFGISKLMANPSMTATSLVMGTPQYMSPEQLRNSAKVDGRADIYSVGVMLYEVLVGIIPVSGPKPMAEVAREVPSTLDPIIGKCLEPDPDKRYRNASELRRDLDRLRNVIEPSANLTPVTFAARPADPWRTAQRLAGASLFVLIVCGVTAGIVKAEQNRRALAPNFPAAPTTEMGAEAIDVDPPQFLGGVIDEARKKANAAYLQLPVNIRPAARRFLDEADAFRDKFLAASDPKSARASGEKALERYVAVAMWPTVPGMVFIPAGEVIADSSNGAPEAILVGPFFIDAHEVTAAEYAEFARRAEWRWADVDASPTPIMRLPYYDAQAFAARQTPPKQLPEFRQLARAIDYAKTNGILFPWPDEEAEDPEETSTEDTAAPGSDYGIRIHEDSLAWTRTVVSGDAPKPGFGSRVRVAGGHFDEGATTYSMTANAVPYENPQSIDVVFRCVFEMPTDPAQVTAALASQ